MKYSSGVLNGNLAFLAISVENKGVSDHSKSLTAVPERGIDSLQ